MTFTFTMDAFPGKTKNSGSKKVLCEINVLDGINEFIDITVTAKDATHTSVVVDNKMANVTYQYKIDSSAITDAFVPGTTSAPSTDSYPLVLFTSSDDNDFEFLTNSKTHIKVVAVSGGKVIAQSNDTAIPSYSD